MANIHETLKEVQSLYAEVVKLQKEILASHRSRRAMWRRSRRGTSQRIR